MGRGQRSLRRGLVLASVLSILGCVGPDRAAVQSGGHARPQQASDFNRDGYSDLAVGVPGEDRNRGAVSVIYGSPEGLNATGNQLWRRSSAGILGASRRGEQFGYALTAADFDGDGDADLAVGAFTGVTIIPGSRSGLTAQGSQLVRLGGVEALAAGDFDGDGHADLAIGTPSATPGGTVHVLYGSPNGLAAGGRRQLWTQDSDGIHGEAAAAERFGEALAAANFGTGHQVDLAIGVPYEGNSAGAVNVIYGSPRGLAAEGNQMWTQDSHGVKGVARGLSEPDNYYGDYFGSALAAANLGRGRQADLAVGAPGEGAVNVLYGSRPGLTSDGNQIWRRSSPGIQGSAARWDGFGRGLAAADFGHRRHADLAVGAHHAGTVNVIYGSVEGLTATGSQLWVGNRSGITDASDSGGGGDEFGWAMAGADFGNGSRADLAIGAPGAIQGAGPGGAGGVTVLFGQASGLTDADADLWTQDSPGIQGVPEVGEQEDLGDGFGFSLIAGATGRR